MIRRGLRYVEVITPKGVVIVARALFERVEAKTQPADQPLLRDYDWWRLVSLLVNGVSFASMVQKGR